MCPPCASGPNAHAHGSGILKSTGQREKGGGTAHGIRCSPSKCFPFFSSLYLGWRWREEGRRKSDAAGEATPRLVSAVSLHKSGQPATFRRREREAGCVFRACSRSLAILFVRPWVSQAHSAAY